MLTNVESSSVGDDFGERTCVDALDRSDLKPVPSSGLEVVQGHVQRLDNHRQVLSVRHGVVVDVVVAFVGDALGMIERRVDPVKTHAVGRQNSSAQVNRRRKISTSGLRHRCSRHIATAALVMQPFQTVAEDIFIWSVRPERSVNSTI